ncbi:tryptophan transporter [Neobacillus notoginsengisoli]|uniref:Tryptophan transporter n=1 Tax=Neobacillus notoginsengisoli TaxID=1578198 RepID=A0A417YZ26_9BACI|nr:tryptophan transporter [Neobacillus notoginsengisoli]RHW43132.1 tryptophan transporter [Neobacillus notoginsengisoli]
MNTKNLVALSLLMGIGAVLHAVIPGIGNGMKPDMMLTMMFLGIMLFPDKKNVLLVGIVTGLLSALTTSFPAGQLPNIIDKLVTAFVFYLLFLAFKKFSHTLVGAGALTAVGTIVSGSVFLGSAQFIAGLPGSMTFGALFVGVVLPAVALNTITISVVYPVVRSVIKRTGFSPVQAAVQEQK